MEGKIDIKIRSNKNDLFLFCVIAVLTIALVMAFGIAVFISLKTNYCILDCPKPTPATKKTGGTTNAVPLCEVQDEDNNDDVIFGEAEATTSPSPAATHSANPKPHSRKNSTSTNPTTSPAITARLPFMNTTHSRRSTVTNPTASTLTSTASIFHLRYISAKRNPVPSGKTSTPPARTPVLQTTRKSTRRIEITGKIYFNGKAPAAEFPPNSHLIVDFADVSLADAAMVLLGKTVVDLSVYRKGKPLSYNITCKRPKREHGWYDVSAVFNVGWKPSGDDWIRKEDYYTDTFFEVHIKHEKTRYHRNIELVQYD